MRNNGGAALNQKVIAKRELIRQLHSRLDTSKANITSINQRLSAIKKAKVKPAAEPVVKVKPTKAKAVKAPKAPKAAPKVKKAPKEKQAAPVKPDTGMNALAGKDADFVPTQLHRLEGMVKKLMEVDKSQVTGLKIIRNDDGFAESVELVRGK